MPRYYSEADTRANFIDPKLSESGWTSDLIRREYYFTDGRKLLGNKRGQRLFLDYLLRYNQVNLAIVEAKKTGEHPTTGLQQAIHYARKLKVDYVYSTNGLEIYEFRLSTGKGDYVESFPAPQELYYRLYGASAALKTRFHKIPFLLTGPFQPRYYQEIAVQTALDRIADGQKRILLTLATGTGKTFIAFQIVHKLLEAKWNLDDSTRRPRILFLADRNVLADQAINTFNPYENDLVKIDGEEVRRRNGVVPTNAYIFFAIYQAIADRSGNVDDADEDTGESKIGGYYRQYPSDFFDMIIIDECHRGSANAEGSWRAILNYFGEAVHVGLTATPKREDNVDTYSYFGQPVYEYSLNDGIMDGYLTPYKVKRIRTNIDEYIHTHDNRVLQGEVTRDRYEIKDFEREIILPRRTDLLGRTILEQIRPMDKTIVFCYDQAHALDLRDAINRYKKVSDPEYCVRVTSDEGKIGRELLENFQDNDRDIPVILTSSKMLTTGVDARNVRNIVLTAPIGSMVEFKQIIGRGTRVFEGKDFFTIIDFVGATDKFYDAEWDGLPDEEIQIEESDGFGKELAVETEPGLDQAAEEEAKIKTPKKERLIIELSNGRKVRVIDVDIRYIDETGRPLTAREFLEKLIGELPAMYQDIVQLREIWAHPDTRRELLEELVNLGFDREQLELLRNMIADPDSDLFDVLAHLSFSTEIRTRKERASAVRKDSFMSRYEHQRARQFLEYILDVYENHGIDELDKDKLSDMVRINFGTTRDARDVFGDMGSIVTAYHDIQRAIYRM